MISDIEARLRRVERLLEELDFQIQADSAAQGAVEQAIIAFREAPYSAQTSGSTGATLTVLVVRSCDQTPIAGASVQVTQSGATVGSGVTDSTGKVGFSLAKTGSTTVSASATDYQTGSITINLGPGATNTEVTLATDSAHVCCTNCPVLMPSVLHLTDPLGTMTLTWNPNRGAWEGCRPFSDPSGSTPFGTGCSAPMPITSTQVYQFFCTDAGIAWRLIVSFPCCADASSASFGLPLAETCSDPPIVGGCGANGSPLSASCNPPNFVFQLSSQPLFGNQPASIVITS